MSLPLVNTPQLLSPDDVFGVALANRCVSRHNDHVAHLGVEHTVGASGAGEHASIQIARAVCVYTPPLFRTDGNTNPYRDSVAVAGGFCYGFDQAPTWSSWVVGGESIFVLEFVTAGELIGFSHHAFMDASPSYSADMLSVIKARCELVDLTRAGDTRIVGGRVWLGNRTAIDKFQQGMIVAHVAI